MTTVRKVSLAAVAIVVVLPLAIVISTIAVIRSCSDDGQRLPMGEDQSWLSARAARKLCEEFLSKQGYTNAQLESETAIMQKSWYKFATNGTTAPLTVIVDRKNRAVSWKQ